MKTIILFLIISACGKNKMPPAERFEENAFASNTNVSESEYPEIGKDLMDYNDIKTVKAVFGFNGGPNGRRWMESPITELDLKKETMALMGSDEMMIKSWKYFGEWTRLELKKFHTEADITDQSSVEIKIVFEKLAQIPFEIAIIKGDDVRVLGAWSQTVKFKISSEQFLDLQNKEAHLAINLLGERERRRQFENSSYRVMLFDGNNLHRLHISKNLSFENLLNILKVDDPEDAALTNFRLEDYNVKRGQKRQISTGEYYISYASPLEIKNLLIERLDKKIIHLNRSHGQGTSIQFSKPAKSILYLKIFAAQTKNNFEDTVLTFAPSEGFLFNCFMSKRGVVGQSNYDTKNIDLTHSFEILGDGKSIKTNDADSFIQRIDSNGNVFWEGAIDFKAGEIDFRLNQLANNHLIDGLYAKRCESPFDKWIYNLEPLSTTQLPIEVSLSLTIEAYVEKLK